MAMSKLMVILRATKRMLMHAGSEFVSHGAPQNAAAISYYVLFSILPLMIFIIGTAGLIFGSESKVREDIVDQVVEEFPLSEDEGRNEVEDVIQGIEGPGSGIAGIVALVAMMWGASGMFGAIRRSLNAAFDDEEVKRPFVTQKLIDLALVLLLAGAFAASVIVGAAMRYVSDASNPLLGLEDLADDLGFLWPGMSFIVPAIIALVGFLVVYTIVPSRLRSPAEVWPGAVLAALLFQVVSLGFGIYLDTFGGGNIVFTALGGVAVFLFWVYIVSNIMIFGAEVAAEYPRTSFEPVDQPAMKLASEPLKDRIWGAVRGLFVLPKETGATGGYDDNVARAENGSLDVREEAAVSTEPERR
jgi:membrane protein